MHSTVTSDNKAPSSLTSTIIILLSLRTRRQGGLNIIQRDAVKHLHSSLLLLKASKEDKYEWTKLLGYIQYETVSAICLYTPRPRVYLANLFPSICANVCVQQPAVLFISTVRYIRL